VRAQLDHGLGQARLTHRHHGAVGVQAEVGASRVLRQGFQARQFEEVRQQRQAFGQPVFAAIGLAGTQGVFMGVRQRRQIVQRKAFGPHGQLADPIAAVAVEQRLGRHLRLRAAQRKHLHLAEVLALGQQLDKGRCQCQGVAGGEHGDLFAQRAGALSQEAQVAGQGRCAGGDRMHLDVVVKGTRVNGRAGVVDRQAAVAGQLMDPVQGFF